MYSEKSFGKINLSLEVIEKRKDGYHNIDTLISKIDIFDEIYFKKISGNNLILKSNNKNFPTDSSNLIYKGWDILKKYADKDVGMEIYVKKNLPIAAGLGGGTSNGITVMKVLNKLWNLGFSKEELIELSKPLGADSTLFFYDGLLRAKGIGEKIEVLRPTKNIPLLLINPGKPISTKDVYDNIKNYSNGEIEKVIENLDRLDYLYNNMEEVSFKIHPELEKIKKELLNSGAKSALMSGSGPTIFSVFDSEIKRDMVYTKFLGKYKYVKKTKTI